MLVRLLFYFSMMTSWGGFILVFILLMLITLWFINYVFLLWFFESCEFFNYFSIFSVGYFDFYTSLLLVLIFMFVFLLLLDNVNAFLTGEGGS
jgi:hypothetical protein